MKKFTFYLQLMAVLFLGSLIMSSCSDSSTDVEEEGSKPSSKPSYNYQDYTYPTFKETNAPYSLLFERDQIGETHDLWRLTIVFDISKDKELDDFYGMWLSIILPHADEIDASNFILPGYYPIMTQNYESGDVKPFTLYKGAEEESINSRIYYVIAKHPSGTTELANYIPTKGDVLVRHLTKESCDVEFHFLLEGHAPFYYSVKSSDYEKFQIEWRYE